MLCRSLLSIPSNAPRMLINADILGADITVFDLEDSVAMTEKDTAREMLKSFLLSGISTCYSIVRVNDVHTPYFVSDVEAILPLPIKGIMLPKAETAEEIAYADEVMTRVEKERGVEPGSKLIFPIAESSMGVENSFDYLRASPRIRCFSFGGEDYAANMGIKRLRSNEEIDYARKKLVVVGKALGKKVIDTVFVDIDDTGGLIAEAEYVRRLGFDGKFIISPRHVELVNRAFSPSASEICHAKRVIAAMEEAARLGLGAVSFDGKMLDKPVLDQANNILSIARQIGIDLTEGEDIS